MPPVAPEAPPIPPQAPRMARPLSPHLQVYRPQLTSVLSITHRATGVALAAGTLLLTWGLLAAAAGPEYFAVVQAVCGPGVSGCVSPSVGLSCLFSLAPPFPPLLLCAVLCFWLHAPAPSCR